ncbi:MAG: hypothetical protein M3Z02_05270 [Actinomycetota bacterium]|nr:hypothetical protein [Actinomycetota bacterium]
MIKPASLKAATTVRLIAVVSLVVAAACASELGWGSPAWWAIPALAAAVTLGEVAVVHLAFGRQRWMFSCTDGAIAAAIALSAGSWTVVAVFLGVLAAQLHRRMPRQKIEFNVSQFAAGTAAAALMASLTGGGVLGACAGMAVFWLVNHVAVAIAVAATSRRRLRELLLQSAPLAAVHSAGNCSMGLLAAWLVVVSPIGLLGLLVPLALLWSSYDQQTRRAAEARLFAELARGQERATGRSIDVSAQVVLTAAARLFGGADVEMVLLDADGPVRYAGDEYGVPERTRVDPNAFDEPWVLRALGARGVSLGSDDGRPFCSAVLGDPEHPLAVLVARRPRGAASFGRREAMLAQVLVGQAESWLSVADLAARHDAAVDRVKAADEAARALGDLGAHTTTSLLVLRESAARLARLTETAGSPERVGDIVDELHAVERAVASLLGAIVLNAEPDLGMTVSGTIEDPVVLPPQRPATDWTTTGVLEGVER